MNYDTVASAQQRQQHAYNGTSAGIISSHSASSATLAGNMNWASVSKDDDFGARQMFPNEVLPIKYAGGTNLEFNSASPMSQMYGNGAIDSTRAAGFALPQSLSASAAFNMGYTMQESNDQALQQQQPIYLADTSSIPIIQQQDIDIQRQQFLQAQYQQTPANFGGANAAMQRSDVMSGGTTLPNGIGNLNQLQQMRLYQLQHPLPLIQSPQSMHTSVGTLTSFPIQQPYQQQHQHQPPPLPQQQQQYQQQSQQQQQYQQQQYQQQQYQQQQQQQQHQQQQHQQQLHLQLKQLQQQQQLQQFQQAQHLQQQQHQVSENHQLIQMDPQNLHQTVKKHDLLRTARASSVSSINSTNTTLLLTTAHPQVTSLPSDPGRQWAGPSSAESSAHSTPINAAKILTTKQGMAIGTDVTTLAAEDPFYTQLLEILQKERVSLRIPSLSGRPLDLKVVYEYVHQMGGFEAMSHSKRWRDLANLLGLPQSNSNIPSLIRRAYKNLLLPLEHLQKDSKPLPTQPNHSPPPAIHTAQQQAQPLSSQQIHTAHFSQQRDEGFVPNTSATLLSSSIANWSTLGGIDGSIADSGALPVFNTISQRQLLLSSSQSQRTVEQQTSAQIMNVSSSYTSSVSPIVQQGTTTQLLPSFNSASISVLGDTNILSQPLQISPTSLDPSPSNSEDLSERPLNPTDITAEGSHADISDLAKSETTARDTTSSIMPAKVVPSQSNISGFSPDVYEYKKYMPRYASLPSTSAGGIDLLAVEKYMAVLKGGSSLAFIEKWKQAAKRPKLSAQLKKELGPVSIQVLIMSLKSTLSSSITYALNMLTFLSSDATVPFYLNECPELLDELHTIVQTGWVDALNRPPQSSTSSRTSTSPPNTSGFFTDLDPRPTLVGDVLQGEKQETQGENFVTMAERAHCVLNILRNLSFLGQNVALLASHKVFLRILSDVARISLRVLQKTCWPQFHFVSVGPSSYHNFVNSRDSRALVVLALEMMEHVLTLYSNISEILVLPPLSEQRAQHTKQRNGEDCSDDGELATTIFDTVLFFVTLPAWVPRLQIYGTVDRDWSNTDSAAASHTSANIRTAAGAVADTEEHFRLISTGPTHTVNLVGSVLPLSQSLSLSSLSFSKGDYASVRIWQCLAVCVLTNLLIMVDNQAQWTRLFSGEYTRAQYGEGVVFALSQRQQRDDRNCLMLLSQLCTWSPVNRVMDDSSDGSVTEEGLPWWWGLWSDEVNYGPGYGRHPLSNQYDQPYGFSPRIGQRRPRTEELVELETSLLGVKHLHLCRSFMDAARRAWERGWKTQTMRIVEEEVDATAAAILAKLSMQNNDLQLDTQLQQHACTYNVMQRVAQMRRAHVSAVTNLAIHLVRFACTVTGNLPSTMAIIRKGERSNTAPMAVPAERLAQVHGLARRAAEVALEIVVAGNVNTGDIEQRCRQHQRPVYSARILSEAPDVNTEHGKEQEGKKKRPLESIEENARQRRRLPGYDNDQENDFRDLVARRLAQVMQKSQRSSDPRLEQEMWTLCGIGSNFNNYRERPTTLGYNLEDMTMMRVTRPMLLDTRMVQETVLRFINRNDAALETVVRDYCWRIFAA